MAERGYGRPKAGASCGTVRQHHTRYSPLLVAIPTANSPVKARLTVTNIPLLKTLNPTMLEGTQLDTAATIFEEFREVEFMPASRGHTDPSREALDRRVICDMLRLDEVFYTGVRRLSRSLCNEPVLIGR